MTIKQAMPSDQQVTKPEYKSAFANNMDSKRKVSEALMPKRRSPLSNWFPLALSGCLFTLLASSACPLMAAWDDVLREPQTKRSHKAPKNPALTDGIDVDPVDRIKPSAKGTWYESLVEDELKGKPASKELQVLETLISQLDMVAAAVGNPVQQAMLKSNLALGFVHHGNFLRAEQIALDCLKRVEKLTAPNSLEILMCLRSLATLYDYVGDYERSLPLTQKCLDIVLSNPKLDRRHIPALQSVLAERQMKCGLLDEASRNAQEALRTARSQKDDDSTLPLQANAAIAMNHGDYTAAETFLKEALEIKRPQYAEYDKASDAKNMKKAAELGSSIIYVTLLKDLFSLYALQGKSPDADLIEKELDRLWRKEYLDTRSLEWAEIQAAKSTFALADGQNDRARSYATNYLKYQNDNLEFALGMVESQRLGWQRKNLSFTMPVAFCPPEELADYVLRWKGVVLDSLVNDRKLLQASKSSEAWKNLKNLAVLRRQLAQLLIGQTDPQTVKNSQGATELLKNKIFSIERRMAQDSKLAGSASVAGKVDAKLISETLPYDTVLVEFITFRELPDRIFGREFLGAVVLGSNEEPRWIPLGDAASVQQALRGLSSYLSHGLKGEAAESGFINSLLGSNQEPQTCDPLRKLYEKLAQPVVNALPQRIKRLYISPDGPLNFVPFACLQAADGSFLSETYTIAYLGSGRDLLRKGSPRAGRQIAVFANPEFGQSSNDTPSTPLAMRSTELAAFGKLQLSALPATKVEAVTIEKTARDNEWQTETYYDSAASEENIRSLRKPSVLHLATHGFYLNAATSVAPDDRGMSVAGVEPHKGTLDQDTLLGRRIDPMRASGIALSGAEETLSAWSRGQAPDPETDGILTAEEVGSLDLNGTWLVTLSACETGVGEARSGEGVFGLRRAFMMAGAENLLMTLWPVADDTTASIMADFYKEALATGDAPGSLAKVQRDWLVKLREEKGLASAIREAGPFAMVMMTAPTYPPVELPPIAALEPKDPPASEPPTQPADGSTTEKKSGWWPF